MELAEYFQYMGTALLFIAGYAMGTADGKLTERREQAK